MVKQFAGIAYSIHQKYTPNNNLSVYKLCNYRYHKSLVGRDYKAWAQVGIFIVWSYLTPSEKSMWLSLAKV